MKKIQFYKYQGTGNDFVMIDNRDLTFPKSTQLINDVCDRRFGVGADGLILLENDSDYDFRMVYYNSDGNESSMCGNGGRCLVAFAHFLGVIDEKTKFIAIDGEHQAIVKGDEISLQMQDVSEIVQKENATFMNTGSPHHIEIRDDIDTIDIKKEGAKIRYGVYGEEGSNVNFVELMSEKNHFKVRTYERGVEDETFSCGTGVTAVALAMHSLGKSENQEITLHTKGGILTVQFESKGNGYRNIWLTGPAKQVFQGQW